MVLYEASCIVSGDGSNPISVCLEIYIKQANRNTGYPLNSNQVGVIRHILSTFIEWRNGEEGRRHVMPCTLILDSLQSETVII